MITWLVPPLSIIEIWEALFELDADSCLGIDGLTLYFFTNLWDMIKEDPSKHMRRSSHLAICQRNLDNE